MKLIAFVAPKEYGKTTACNILKEYYGSDNVVQINFKDGLIAELKDKYMLLLLEFGNIYNMTVDELFEKKPPAVRRLMQSHGQMRRDENPDYWIGIWYNTIYKYRYKDIVILTDDCRYVNEACLASVIGANLIRLNRTDKTNTDTHPSEQEQKDIVCDYEITVGEGEIDILKEKLIQIAEVL